MKTGSKVLIYYLIATYGAQSLFAIFLPSYLGQDYKGYDRDLFLKLILMIFVAAAIFIGQAVINGRLEKRRVSTSSTSNIIGLVAYNLRLPSSVIFISLSVPFGIIYGFSFFHSGLFISDLPPWVMILQAMKSVARLDLAYCVIKVLRGEKLNNVDITATSLYTLGGIASLAGAVDIVFLALGVLLIYKRGGLAIRAFTTVGKQSKGVMRWFAYFLLAVSLPAAAFIGFANKIGVDRTVQLVSNGDLFLDSFAVPLALRVSSSHGSFVANAELPLSLSEQVEGIWYPLRNLTWRACILLIQTGCPVRDDITHIARLNYVRTFWDQSPLKAGATPGLLASALYIPFLPLSLFFLAFYCSLFTGAINRALGDRKLPILGTLLLFLFSYPAFEDPVDLLIIFDPAPAYTVGLYFIFRSFRPFSPGSLRQQRQHAGSRVTRIGSLQNRRYADLGSHGKV